MLQRLRDRFLSPSPRRSNADDPFDPETIAQLDQMRLRLAGVRGTRPGDTRVSGETQASGIEVESFQPYTPGDDIRHVDWIAYGRLDQLLTKTFVAEREVPVHLLLDVSGSMDRPANDDKLSFAKALAGGLAYLALAAGDTARVSSFRREGERVDLRETRELRHRGRFFELAPFFSSLEGGGETAIHAAVSEIVGRHGSSGGAVFLISDFLAPSDDLQHSVEQLAASGLVSMALHVVGREEREGPIGRLLLKDVETGDVRSVVVGERARREYREAFQRRLDEVRELCHRWGVGYATAHADRGVASFFTSELADRGLLKVG